MDRTVALRVLPETVDTVLASLEASLSDVRATGEAPEIFDELQQIVDEILANLGSTS